MTDTTLTLVILGFAVGMLVWLGIIPAVLAIRRLAGTRLVTCPATRDVAAVGFDRTHAVKTALAHYEAEPQLGRCSLWPGLYGCDQACLTEALKPDTDVTTFVEHWRSGRRCVLCRTLLVDSPFVGHHFALRSANGMTTEWPDLPPQALPEALRTRLPVCWNCHIAESFRRDFPHLVTDREHGASPGRT
jgi:hypothetical protein